MGILQVRILEWVAMPSSRGSSQPRDRTQVSCIAVRFFFFFFLIFKLHNCISFAKYQNESITGIHVLPILNPPPSPYYPSGSSQCTSPKHPVSCIEPGLASRFIHDILHVSMPQLEKSPHSKEDQAQPKINKIAF